MAKKKVKLKQEQKEIFCPAVDQYKLEDLNELKRKLDGLPYEALMYVKGAVEAIRAIQ